MFGDAGPARQGLLVYDFTPCRSQWGHRKRRWRQYETPTGRKPALEFIRRLPDEDKAAVLAAMAEVRDEGTAAGRRLDGDIYEVRADGNRVIYRVLFAEEGENSQVLLALEAFQKRTQKTPPEKIKHRPRRRAGCARRDGRGIHRDQS
jgi:phage-related protein